MYVDALFDRDHDTIHVVERIGGKRNFRKFSAQYVFYYLDSRGKFISIYGDSLSRVNTTTGKHFHREKKLYKHKKLYESDINPIFKCLSENYADGEAPTLHKCFFDIEVDFDTNKGFADPSDAFAPVNAISLYLSWIDKLITLCIKPNTLTTFEGQDIVDKFNDTILCHNEEELLETFLSLIDDADVLSGWNSEGFDIPYMVNRTARILGKQRTREFCLWGQLPKKREYEKYGREQASYDLKGRIHLDYLELYRKYTYHEMHSYSLDAIGEYELGERKIAYDGTLDQLFKNDFETFIEYNRQDCILLKKFDEKLQFIDLSNVLAHANTVLIQTTMGAVAVTDQGIINEAHRQNLIVPDKVHDKDTTTAAGAYVAYPKKGMHHWIGSIDISSLYPSILRSLNMSPETIVGQVRQTLTKELLESHNYKIAEAWEGKFSSPEYDLVMEKDTNVILNLDFEDKSTIEATGAQIYDMVFHGEHKWMITANGTIFNYNKKGVIPALLERWYQERTELQRKANQALQHKNNIEYEFWDKRQLVKKINLNSLYGALLNPGSRFFDQRLGQSTTLCGRNIVRHMSAEINKILTGKYDHVGETIIYGDTDSCYFSAYPVFEKDIKEGKLDWNKEKAVELYDAICKEANTTFPSFMSKAFNVPRDQGKLISASKETISSAGIFITKKRYAVLVYDLEGHRVDIDEPGKIKAMGLDLKRSDTPAYMQTFLSELLLMTLTDGTEETIIDKIQEFRNDFRNKPNWEKGTPKRVNNLTKHTKIYEKTGRCGIGHAMAAINWNKLRKMYSDRYSLEIVDGMKTIVCKLRNNPMNMTSVAYPIDELRIPSWYKELPFDNDAMETTIIDKKLDNLLGVLKWDLRKSKTNEAFDKLFDWA